jgi:hypothetical protein
MARLVLSVLFPVIKYPKTISIEKLTKRNQKTNQLFLFLPERLPENLISISQANIRNGNPSSIAISDNLERISEEMMGVRNVLISTCPHIP